MKGTRFRVLVAALLLAPALVLAQGGGGGGGGGPPPTPGGGGGPPDGGEEGAGNNLSYPILFTGAATVSAVVENYAGAFVYGCDIPVTVDDQFSYPNTACVTADGTALSYAACAAGPCATSVATISRIYVQQDALNRWQADWLQNVGPRTATYLDWGDNLESVSWSSTSIIRVETTPFFDSGTAAGTDPLVLEPLDPFQGFQMWHVIGQGPDEMWGVRATNPPDVGGLVVPGVPYVYSSPFKIIHTPNARLLLTKLYAGSETCPNPPATPGTFTWTDANVWSGAAYNAAPVVYTTELNIGGKIVYGYNWKMKNTPVPEGVEKGGWWRLTFYTTDDSVLFDATSPVLAAPILPPAAPEIVLAEGPLYTPVYDSANNLTYIDICITAAKGGGGRKPPSPGE